MDLTIQRLNGTKYLLADYGIKTLDFKIGAPVPRLQTETIDGRDGNLDLGAQYDSRQLRGSFFMTAVDGDDFALLRNEIFRIFAGREAFYVIDSREAGKRWLVRHSGFSIEQLVATRGRFDIDFVAHSPFAESIGTTLDPLTFDAELWQTGGGLTLDETMYTHSTNTFQIYNGADGVTIDPRSIPLVITYTGASTNLEIKNVTTGDTWQYTGTTIATDVLKLDGVRSLKNNVSAFGATNRKLITLAPGYNDFQLTGTSGSFTISFAFRFYTL